MLVFNNLNEEEIKTLNFWQCKQVGLESEAETKKYYTNGLVVYFDTGLGHPMLKKVNTKYKGSYNFIDSDSFILITYNYPELVKYSPDFETAIEMGMDYANSAIFTLSVLNLGLSKDNYDALRTERRPMSNIKTAHITTIFRTAYSLEYGVTEVVGRMLETYFNKHLTRTSRDWFTGIMKVHRGLTYENVKSYVMHNFTPFIPDSNETVIAMVDNMNIIVSENVKAMEEFSQFVTDNNARIESDILASVKEEINQRRKAAEERIRAAIRAEERSNPEYYLKKRQAKMERAKQKKS